MFNCGMTEVPPRTHPGGAPACPRHKPSLHISSHRLLSSLSGLGRERRVNGVGLDQTLVEDEGVHAILNDVRCRCRFRRTAVRTAALCLPIRRAGSTNQLVYLVVALFAAFLL